MSRRRYTLLTGERRARVAKLAREVYERGVSLQETAAELAELPDGAAVSKNTVRKLVEEAGGTVRPPSYPASWGLTERPASSDQPDAEGGEL